MIEPLTGKVLRSIRGHFWVAAGDEVFHCLARDSLIKASKGSTPLTVGDDVRFELVDEANREGIIIEVLPRRTKLSRRVQPSSSEGSGYEDVVAANVDQLVIVASVRQPPLRPGLIDRYLVAAGKGGLDPIICLNKIDLAQPREVEPVVEIYRDLGYPVILTSARSGQGVDELRHHLKDKISVFAGHSGVGKSTLLKQLCPGIEVKVAEVNPKTGRGRHATTAAQLVPLPEGGYVIDTPGIRQFGLWDLTLEDVQTYFVEIAEAARGCRFRDCSHTVEPGCAVRQAVQQGRIHPQRLEHFLRLREESKQARAF
ncbi:MAG: ribosome small subunit-dependent GTPase A [Acidobacteria bacterium]|nr:MAG: ribosome small subunit-dependent GTPase A [Acidobacteriota bacterium]